MTYHLLVLFFVACLGPASASAQTTWQIAEGPSTVAFSVKHFYLSQVDGIFRSFSGTVESPSDDFSNAHIDATIAVKSIYTGLPLRDQDLMKPYFFYQKEHPALFFKSTSFEKTGDSTYTIIGDLTMRGVTKPIELQAIRYNEHTIRYGKHRVDFRAMGQVDRFDYGLEWNKIAEFGHAIVSQMVDISLNIVLIEE